MGKRNYVKAEKVTIDNIEFDSKAEGEMYLLLKNDPDVVDLECHPVFTLVEPFQVVCGACGGDKVAPSPKTGKPIKCSWCKGEGVKKRQGMVYTADFHVRYRDGKEKVIDVKGWANERFPVVRKLFEKQHGAELVVMTKKNGKWVRRR